VAEEAPTGFWGRFEARVSDFLSDRARVARAFQLAYWLSMLVVLAGIVLIGAHYLRGWP
jgi:hypothetical protein